MAMMGAITQQQQHARVVLANGGPVMAAAPKRVRDDRIEDALEMGELSPAELAELAERFPGLRASNDPSRRICRGADLVRLLESISPDPGFADDIEAGVRERRAMAESQVSPWKR